MKKFGEWICKNKKLILIVSCILMVISIIGMSLTKVNYDILVYLPKNIETIKGQEILTDDFEMGSYSIAVVDNMNAKDILKLEDKISSVEGVNKVESLYDAVGTSIPLEMLPTEIVDKLHKGDQDLLLITFYDSTSSEKTLSAVEEIREITDNKISQGGMSSMVLDTMNLSNKEIVIYVCIAVVLCIIVLELSIDSYVIPFILLLNIGCAILFNLGSNIFLGQISYITKALVAVLQLGVTTDFSIFLYHSYENKKKNSISKEKAMEEAIAETFTSVSGSSLTTIAGFLVLCAMQLTLGKDLGIVMAKGVLIGVICVLTLFPSLLLVFDKIIEKTKHKVLVPNFTKLNKFVIKYNKAIFILFLILLIPTYLAYRNVEVYYKLDKSLPKTLESIKTNTKLKDDFNIVSPEIILINKNIKTEKAIDMLDEIENVDGIDMVMSYAKIKQMGITENMIDSETLKIVENDKYQMILVNSTYDVATDELNHQIDQVNNIVKKYDANGIVAGEGALTKDLISICDVDFNNVNYSSIACIFLILFIVLKSFSLPFLLIISIEFAIFTNMSISYFNGTVLPFIAPIVLGTIQLGATIDYAILMTTTYIKKRNNNIEKNKAMLDTLNYCGQSIFISGMCFFAATFGVGIYSKIEMIGSLCTLISRGALISMAVVITILPSILLIFDKIILKTKLKGSKNMKKVIKKTLTVSMLAFMLIMPFQTLAMTKNETVYSKLDSYGKVQNILVNEQLINNQNLEELKDYSELKNILNVSNDNAFTQNNNNLSWNALKKDVFYQGTIDKKLPVDETITYFLDNKEMKLDEILGKSGSVKIVIKYKNNDSHYVSVNNKNTLLYTPFVVTMGTVINSKDNTNVTVTNGKVISNGTNNIVAAIAVPGLYQSLKFNELSGKDTITIKLNTTNFELPSIYSVVTPKIIDTSDLNIFNKMDDIYDKVDTLQNKMNEIDEGAQKISSGTTLLTNTLNDSINSLKADNSDALTAEQINNIKETTITSVKNTFTDEYKLSISNNAWNQTKEMLTTSSDTTIENYGTSAVQTILASYLGGQENLTYYGGCIQGNNNACLLLTTQGYDINTINTFAQTLKNEITNTLNSTTNYIAENVSKSVAVSTAETSSIETAKSVSTTLSQSVANEVKKEAVNETINSLTNLYNNIEKINESVNTLSAGITTFNNEGIKEISSLVNNDIKTNTETIKALGNLANNYDSFANKLNNTNSETKFILVVDSKKADKANKINTGDTAKLTFWDRVKNLFK